MYFKHWFPYLLSLCVNTMWVSWPYNKFLCPVFFRSCGVSWFFQSGGLVHRCWREFLQYSLVFGFECSFQNDECYYLFLLLVYFYFFNFSFDVRRYNDAYLSCAYVPRSMEFTTFIDESVRKNKSISSSHWVIRFYLKLHGKDCVSKNI